MYRVEGFVVSRQGGRTAVTRQEIRQARHRRPNVSRIVEQVVAPADTELIEGSVELRRERRFLPLPHGRHLIGVRELIETAAYDSACGAWGLNAVTDPATTREFTGRIPEAITRIGQQLVHDIQRVGL